jgi:hypothetical protein
MGRFYCAYVMAYRKILYFQWTLCQVHQDMSAAGCHVIQIMKGVVMDITILLLTSFARNGFLIAFRISGLDVRLP